MVTETFSVDPNGGLLWHDFAEVGCDISNERKVDGLGESDCCIAKRTSQSSTDQKLRFSSRMSRIIYENHHGGISEVVSGEKFRQPLFGF